MVSCKSGKKQGGKVRSRHCAKRHGKDVLLKLGWMPPSVSAIADLCALTVIWHFGLSTLCFTTVVSFSSFFEKGDVIINLLFLHWICMLPVVGSEKCEEQGNSRNSKYRYVYKRQGKRNDEESKIKKIPDGRFC